MAPALVQVALLVIALSFAYAVSFVGRRGRNFPGGTFMSVGAVDLTHNIARTSNAAIDRQLASAAEGKALSPVSATVPTKLQSLTLVFQIYGVVEDIWQDLLSQTWACDSRCHHRSRAGKAFARPQERK